ncbi:efflux transporter outer membrane subunit [Caulobacter mirabilis]|uniref:Fusaric acid resistance protein n=1 Tax=Caulobacter mirabilis TaxID=69666 RepID=A0A2D2B1A2_9CAUL|nr:efflux transporter outer membrane subunit [Caulobacter mirabilis]ATQ44044.1 fusaric acid resistance protein [Caulobacter mirabilis]
MTGHPQPPTGALFLLVCSSLALSACATSADLRPARVEPDLTTLDAGKAIVEAAVSARPGPTNWWAAYGDPQLDWLMNEALQDAPTISVAAARIARAEALLDRARTDQQWQVNGAGQMTGEYFPDRYVYPAPYAGEVGSEGQFMANARYHLDFWGKRRQASEAAAIRVEVEEAQARDAALMLAAAMVEAYVRLDAAYRAHDIARAGLSRRQGVVDLLAIRARAGLATDIDAAQAREAIASTRGEIARLDGEIARRRHEIAALAGRGPGYGETLSRPVLTPLSGPAPVSAIPAQLLGYRPDVAAQRARVEAAAKDVGVARAAFYPDIDLTGFAGIASLGVANLFRAGSGAAGVGAAVSLPIFDAGRLRSGLAARDAEFDQAVGAYEGTIATALQQVADGIVSLRAERERRRLADQSRAHWARVVELQKAREAQGLSNAIDRLSAETALLLSQRDVAEAEARIAVAQVSLIRALGGAWTPNTPSRGS